MVQLSLVSNKGNSGVRYFPYTGYLGLTPIKVEGAVITKLDADRKPLLAKCITIAVRCYEARVGRAGISRAHTLAEYTQTLWSKPEDQQYADVADLELPFRISIPSKVGGHSTCSFVEYRCFWRIEACIDHIPISAVGTRKTKHFELAFVRYDVPPELPLPLPRQRLHLLAGRQGISQIRYHLEPPTAAIGPLDLVSIPISVLPLQQPVSVRGASVTIERRIQFSDTAAASSSSPASPSSSPASYSHMPTRHKNDSAMSLSSDPSSTMAPSSSSTITPDTALNAPSLADLASTSELPLLPPPPPVEPQSASSSSKVHISHIIGGQSSGPFAVTDSGVCNKTLTVQWPAMKSHTRWAIGETMQTELASIKYFACIKLELSTARGHEVVDLAPQELLVVSTNQSERQVAITKYNEILATERSRSKSKSPRRTRNPQLPEPLPPTPANPIVIPSSSNDRRASRKPPRRPHTSSGATHTPTLSFSTRDTKPKHASAIVNLGPGATYGYDMAHAPKSYIAPKIATVSSGGSAISGFSTSSRGSASEDERRRASKVADDAKIRAWEEELARIEAQSRRSSDLLGFGRKLRRLVR
ncbi:hypothetical protein EV714DRAFT_252546 [Schizophyllum commune]